MERKKEFEILAKTLPLASVAKINEVCCQILRERVETIACSDKEMKRIVGKIVSTYTPQIELDVQKIEKPKQTRVPQNAKMFCWVLGVAGIFASTLYCENTNPQEWLAFSWVRFLGSVALGTATYMGALIWSQSKEKKETVYKCKIKQTVEDVINELDMVFDSLKSLLTHNQLERQYLPILIWLRDLWAESDSELRKDVCKLLNRLNYEFVNYSAEISDFFGANKATDVNEITTTRPAIRNKFTGDIVENGYVIIPM